MSTALAATERKALMTLGDEQVAVRLDENGFLKRVLRRVRLNFGTDLYCARKNPSATDKVMPFQPGYMKLVSAMGGQLLCPPTMRDPETGKPRPNPIVETYPDTGIIRRVTATAVCAVPNPLTGEIVASVQTIVLDTEHVLRQALMNQADRDDCVQILAQDDVEQLKKEGKLRGWAVFPLAPPYAFICANMAKKNVRDALDTFQQQSATARQRACTKAERLAADHNPVTRMVWEFAELTFERDDKGELLRAPFKDVNVVAWVEQRGREEMTRMLEALAVDGQAGGIDEVLVSEVIDVSTEEDADDDPENERPMLEEKPPAANLAPRQREHVPAETSPAPAQPRLVPAPEVPVEPAAEGVPAAKQSEPSPQVQRLRLRIRGLESAINQDAINGAREHVGIFDPATEDDVGVLRAYQSALTDAAAGVRR